MKNKIKSHCKQPWQTRVECLRQILTPHDWHSSVDFGVLSFSVSAYQYQLAMCNWHLLLCPVLMNLFLFLVLAHQKHCSKKHLYFQLQLDVKPFKLLHCTCGRAKVFAKFHLKPYEDVFEISESFFKHHTVFPLALAVSNIYDRAAITIMARLWSGGKVVIQLAYYILFTFFEVLKRDELALFFTIISCFAMQWFGGW